MIAAREPEFLPPTVAWSAAHDDTTTTTIRCERCDWTWENPSFAERLKAWHNHDARDHYPRAHGSAS